MIHHGQRLAFGFKARDDFPRVHAQLDDLERDFSPDRLGLLGDIDRAAATFAEFLAQLVAPQRHAHRFVRGGLRQVERGGEDVLGRVGAQDPDGGVMGGE
jgi:hypothetical protein